MIRTLLVMGSLGLGGLAAADEATQCPAQIETQQSLTAKPDGWEESREVRPHKLAQVTLYDGHPKDMASLVPDEDKGGSVAVWHFDAEREYWIACSYEGTDVVLTRRLDKVARCEVTYRKNGTVGKIDCK